MIFLSTLLLNHTTLQNIYIYTHEISNSTFGLPSGEEWDLDDFLVISEEVVLDWMGGGETLVMDIGDFLWEEVLDPAADFSLLLEAADSDLTAVWSDNTEVWLLKHVTENTEDVTQLHDVLTHKLAFPLTLAVCSHILFLSF